MAERWKQIEEWPKYEVSTLGRIRRVYSVTGAKLLKPRIMSQLSHRGYRSVMMSDRLRRKRKEVHGFVLKAFIGPRPSGMEACHKDGNGENNRLYNLRWATHADNYADSVRHGTAVVPPKGANGKFPNIKKPLVCKS